MGTIEVLDKNTIDQIAAGEVVERPASIVKELVENAIDAGATAVTVEIKEGGISFIRITDNGSGIRKDQVRLAFLRHATSKIRTVDDLIQIASLGFRGEALSSISAVAQVELITKTAEDLTGVRYVIEGGEEKSYEEIGAPNGTTFLIRNLFFNTPARAKFLKTPMTEGNAISTCVEQMALSNPQISFKYMQNGQTKLHTSGNQNLKELVYHIYGRDISRELIEINSSSELMEIHGFLAKPSVSRGNRNFENYYVNGRYVKSKLLSKAIEDGYHGFMMQHKYPFTLLYIVMDGTRVDVNVHPAKMELRFSNQEEIYDQLLSAVKEGLMQRERIPQVTIGKDQVAKEEKIPIPKNTVPEPFEQQRRWAGAGRVQSDRPTVSPVNAQKRPDDAQTDKNLYTTGSLPIYPQDYRKVSAVPLAPGKEEIPGPAKSGTPPVKPDVVRENGVTFTSESSEPSPLQEPVILPENQLEIKPEIKPELQPESQSEVQTQIEKVDKEEQLELFDNRLLSKDARISHKIVGQIFDTYWLVQYDDSLYIIDQHAAHEKVLYERMMKEYKNKEITAQYMSPPLIVTLQNQEAELLQKYQELFESFGFEIEPFGGKEYQISAVPSNLYGVASSELFIEILDHLEDTGSKTLDMITEKLASMSCKAAVKGNHRLSGVEVEALIDELLTLENPYNCPHGRPTIISMSRYELEKKFKRIV